MRLPEFKVNIIGLSQKAHRFDYVIDDRFFEHYGKEILDGGRFEAVVTLDKRETLIEAMFQIKGEARLICDRSLDEFPHPMDVEKTIHFKYGAEAQELSDEIVIITRDQVSLDLGQYLYELIVVQIPMKKLHPRFRTAEDEEAPEMVYTSGPAEPKDEDEPIDPRWEKLKKLK